MADNTPIGVYDTDALGAYQLPFVGQNVSPVENKGGHEGP